MTKRRPLPRDTEHIRPILQLAWPKQAWNDARTEQHLGLAGVHRFDTDLAYCHLATNDFEEPFSAVPAGLCTQISTLAPQHHDRAWVNDVLYPLLVTSLRVRSREEPTLRHRPLYALLPDTLIPFWQGKLGSLVDPTVGRKVTLIYVPTLQEALRNA